MHAWLAHAADEAAYNPFGEFALSARISELLVAESIPLEGLRCFLIGDSEPAKDAAGNLMWTDLSPNGNHGEKHSSFATVTCYQLAPLCQCFIVVCGFRANFTLWRTTEKRSGISPCTLHPSFSASRRAVPR